MKLPRRCYRADYIPSQVTVYAAQRGATHAAEGQALLIYHEGESLVSAITENGKLSLARTLEGAEPAQLQMDLPQLALSAALQGINTSFPNVLLDEQCLSLRSTVNMFSPAARNWWAWKRHRLRLRSTFFRRRGGTGANDSLGKSNGANVCSGPAVPMSP